MHASRGLGQVVILAAIFALFAAVFSGFVQPILSGLLVAFVMYPLNERVFGRSAFQVRAGALLGTLLFAVFVLLPLCFVGYILSKDGLELINSLRTGSLSSESLNRLFDRFMEFSPVPREEVVTKGKEVLEVLATTSVAKVGSFVQGLPSFVLSVILFLLTLYYGLSDGPEFGRFIKGHLPFRPELVARLSLRMEQIVRGTVLGTVLSALAQALLIGGAFLALGIPRGFVVGLTTFFFSFIPVLGTAPTGLGGIIYLIAQDSAGKAVGLGVVFLLATMVDNVIKPFVLKGAADLHPLLALLSAIGGLAVFGFIGLFVGPLVTALTIEFLEVFREERLGAEALV